MSLLLDALNKADQERKRNETTPGINSNHENITDHSARNRSIIIAALIIAVTILVVAIYWLGQRSVIATPASVVPSAPNAETSQSQHNKSTRASQSALQIATGENSSIASNASPEDDEKSEASVADLYQQNIQAQNSNATLTISPPPQNASAVEQQTSTVGSEPAAMPSATSITQFANLPDLHDLPSQILEKIPSLNYSEHNYNLNGGSVKINGNIQHANEQLAGGVIIDKILEDGMILHVGNYAFKMRALNSWINM